MPERACDMATAAGAHLRALAAASADAAAAPAAAAAAAAFTPASVLSRIHFFRAYDAVTQAALCAALPELCAARPRVRLIVLDSVAFHYRQGHDDYAARARTLAATFAALMRLATSAGIAVVVTNQMTTKPGAGANETSRLAPALGESFAHAATQRLLLFWSPGGGGRQALLFKSPRRPRGSAPYAVTADGVRTARPRKRAAQSSGGGAQ
jgi:RAD51-like protein 2